MSDYWKNLIKFGENRKKSEFHSVHVQYHDMTQKDCKFWSFGYEGDFSNQEILDFVWEQWNAGSGHESKVFLEKKCRSMMVGDYVSVNGIWHEVLAFGWRIDVPWEEIYGDKPKPEMPTEKAVAKALLAQLDLPSDYPVEFEKN